MIAFARASRNAISTSRTSAGTQPYPLRKTMRSSTKGEIAGTSLGKERSSSMQGPPWSWAIVIGKALPVTTRRPVLALSTMSAHAHLSSGALSMCVGSRIHSAIHGKIRSGNVRGLRTGHERHQRSHLIGATEAVQCRDSLLRYRPIACRGIQIRIDRTRLHVVDRDAPAPELSGQRLSKYLHGSLRSRVGHQPGH